MATPTLEELLPLPHVLPLLTAMVDGDDALISYAFHGVAEDPGPAIAELMGLSKYLLDGVAFLSGRTSFEVLESLALGLRSS